MYIKYIVYINLMLSMLNVYQHIRWFPIGHYAYQFIVYYADCILIGGYLYPIVCSYVLAVCAIWENSWLLEDSIENFEYTEYGN